MGELPILPSCALDEDGVRAQLGRYRTVGRGARVVDRTPGRLVVEVERTVESKAVDELVAVERVCCPFFLLQ